MTKEQATRVVKDYFKEIISYETLPDELITNILIFNKEICKRLMEVDDALEDDRK